MENFTNIIHKLCRVYNVRKEALDHLKKSRKKKKIMIRTVNYLHWHTAAYKQTSFRSTRGMMCLVCETPSRLYIQSDLYTYVYVYICIFKDI